MGFNSAFKGLILSESSD